jgi:hypothetical protein
MLPLLGAAEGISNSLDFHIRLSASVLRKNEEDPYGLVILAKAGMTRTKKSGLAAASRGDSVISLL